MTYRDRVKNALWGLFVADSLAMPAHWFYSRENLQQTFQGGIRGLVDPPHPHPEAFMVGMQYQPNLEIAKGLERPVDILGIHARFYETSYTELTIDRLDREGQHGNAVAAKDQRYHYHTGLKSGDNTLGADLVRVLLRSVSDCGSYQPAHFLRSFVAHLTGPNRGQDPYTEIYLRRWFENYSQGLDPRDCAESQRRVWSIGSQGGLIRPLVLSMLYPNSYLGLGMSIQHAQLTHRSENGVSALAVLVPLLGRLLQGEEPREALRRHAGDMSRPKLRGADMFKMYREHRGPGNIPPEVMWRLHTELEEQSLDLEALSELDDEELADELGTACYTEQGVPLLLTLAYRDHCDPEKCLLANVNLGGDNVHRGMIQGLIAGAAGGEPPQSWVQGLSARSEIEVEIEGFLNALESSEASKTRSSDDESRSAHL